MEVVQPRNDPSSESMTQGQEVKQPAYMPTATNAEGNESGVSDTAGLGTTSGEQAIFTPPANEINISASTENRSAQFKGGAQDVGEYGTNQYQ